LNDNISIEAGTITDLRIAHRNWLRRRRVIRNALVFIVFCGLVSAMNILAPTPISPFQHMLTGLFVGMARPWNLLRQRSLRSLWTAQAIVLGRAASHQAAFMHGPDREMVMAMQDGLNEIDPMDRNTYRAHLARMLPLVPQVSPLAAPWLAAHVALLARGVPSPRILPRFRA
jgi:hypothetical protein